MYRFIITPLVALGLCGGALAQVNPGSLAEMPVQEGGRKKPYLVFAQEGLLGFAGKTKLSIDGQKQDAMEIVTDLWFRPDAWNDKPIILIDSLELKRAVGLDEKTKHFPYSELAANSALIQLFQQVQMARATAPDKDLTGLDEKAEEIGERLAEYESLRNGSVFRIVANPAGDTATWLPLDRNDPHFVALRDAYLAQDQQAFDQAAETLLAHLASVAPQFQPAPWRISLETIYQVVHPFRWAWILYLAAGIVLGVTSVRWQRQGYAIGWGLAIAGFICQLAGFASRIAIAGRPPVTNMYESVIWVAFGTVFFALIFEAIFRSRHLLLGAIPVAVVSLILADSQPAALDSSIQPLVPVLRSNFWLTTHVLTITLSYAAFALALGVAHIALGKVVLGQKPSAVLYNYIYRTLQIGVLLLAVGTILGGVWANYSWGRFWDWDPKETWALVALLTYLFILHGRIAGVWGGFGLAVGAVLGFQTIIMAWYGVNFVLGVGLHSYGFGSGGFGYAITFVAAELLFTAIAIISHRKAPRGNRPVAAPLETSVAHRD